VVEQVVLTGRSNEIEAEIRRVSLLFADIRGSTELVQHLDPEAAANMLGPPIHAMIEEVERYGGVASDRGDGVMAVFGAPSGSEDHALRACLAALAIQERLSGSASPVKVRVGIHFGEVVFRRGRIGKLHMQDVFGAAAHVAARLEQTTEPGTICLSRTAYDLVQGFVTAMPLAPIQAKGIDEPIERLRLLSVDLTKNRWEVQVGKGLAAFAGRSKEMKALRRALAAGKAKGVRLVQIVGAAGLGKSRLVHEFLATEEARECHVIKLAGDPYRQSTAYYPFSAWLRALLGIRRADQVDDARTKLARLLDHFDTASHEERNQIEGMLGLGGRIQSDLTSLDPSKAFGAGGLIAAIILRFAAGRPLILVCEDAEYFDPASLELISSLPGMLQDVLLVSTGRTRSRLHVKNVAVSRSLMLSALSDDDAKKLLASLHDGYRPNSVVTATLLQKAGGNPLFLEEVTSLIARDTQTGSSGHVGANIPDRVEALIADRLGRLPKQQRGLVQACAVIGFDVPLRIAAKLLTISEAELAARLRRLQSDQLLYETSNDPESQFSFKHALTRDVAYNTILPSKRREYHARIVEILEDEAAHSHDAHVDALCMHSVHAQTWRKAATYLRLAAATAVERSSYELAETYLNRALAMSNELSEDVEALRSKIEILLGLRLLVARNSKYEEASRILDLAEGFARQLGDVQLQSRIMLQRMLVLNVLGDARAAVEIAERAQNAGRTLQNPAVVMQATYFLGQAHFNLGDYGAAEDALTQTADMLAVTPVSGPSGTLGTLPVLTHATRALVRAFVGRFDDAAQDAELAKKHAYASRRPYDLSFASFGEGYVHLRRRNGAAAVQSFRQSLSLGESREMTDPGSLPPLLRSAGAEELKRFEASRAAFPHGQAGLGEALLLTGDIEGAAHWLSQAYEIAGANKRYMVQVWAAMGLARLHLATGKTKLALRYADEAVQVALNYEFNGSRVLALRVRGLVRAMSGSSVARAIDDLRVALALASALGMRPEIAHCHAALGLLCGNDDEHQHLQTARSIYQSLDMSESVERLPSPGKPIDSLWY
jgi:class 3 adenylate cyclase/tetratricopeptide (TPR) repeat protein